MGIVSLAYENGMSLGEALNVSVTGIVVVMIVLAALAVFVLLLSRAIQLFVKTGSKAKDSGNPQAEAIPAKENAGFALPDNESAGKLDLFETDEKTAAAIMAIISHESGIPLNKLRFNSIKLVQTDTDNK